MREQDRAEAIDPFSIRSFFRTSKEEAAMTTAAQAFYGTSTLQHATREQVLVGQVIKINPALVTLTDGLIEQVDPQTLQQQVWEQVVELLAYKICTFHVDLNFDDYTGFGQARPQSNLTVFMPAFLERLSLLVASHGGSSTCIC